MHKPKTKFFSNLRSSLRISYFSGIYLESWFSWLWGGSAENSEKKKKTDKRKTLKGEETENEEYEESNNNNIHLWFKIIFYVKTEYDKKLLIPSNFIYSFNSLQDI